MDSSNFSPFVIDVSPLYAKKLGALGTKSALTNTLVQLNFNMAGALGIEPSSGVLETLILPMNYAPLLNTLLLYTY